MQILHITQWIVKSLGWLQGWIRIINPLMFTISTSGLDIYEVISCQPCVSYHRSKIFQLLCFYCLLLLLPQRQSNIYLPSVYQSDFFVFIHRWWFISLWELTVGCYIGDVLHKLCLSVCNAYISLLYLFFHGQEPTWKKTFVHSHTHICTSSLMHKYTVHGVNSE